MFFFVLGEYQDNMYIDDNKIVEVLSKNVVHNVLNDCRGTEKTKMHDIILKMTYLFEKFSSIRLLS